MPSDRVPVRDDCEYDGLPAQTGAVEKDNIVQLSREGGGRHILHIHAVLRQNVAWLVFWSVAASFENSHCRNAFSPSAELSCLCTLAPRTWDSAPPPPRTWDSAPPRPAPPPPSSSRCPSSWRRKCRILDYSRPRPVSRQFPCRKALSEQACQGGNRTRFSKHNLAFGWGFATCIASMRERHVPVWILGFLIPRML